MSAAELLDAGLDDPTVDMPRPGPVLLAVMLVAGLVVLPFEIPRWVAWQARHLLRGFGL